MKKTVIYEMEELKDLLGEIFDCAVKFNTIEEELDGEVVGIDILEIYHNDKNVINVAFPLAVHKDEHLAIVEMSDLYHTIENIVNVTLSEKYNITETDIGQGLKTYLFFNMI